MQSTQPWSRAAIEAHAEARNECPDCDKHVMECECPQSMDCPEVK